MDTPGHGAPAAMFKSQKHEVENHQSPTILEPYGVAFGAGDPCCEFQNQTAHSSIAT